jgi:hypothetical protein
VLASATPAVRMSGKEPVAVLQLELEDVVISSYRISDA